MYHKLYPYFGTLFFAICIGAGLVAHLYKEELPPADIENTAARPPDSLEYHLLAGDIAWQRNLWTQASEHYLILAQKLQRADFALLASSAALEAQALPEARMASQLWAQLEPMKAQAQALSAMLSIAASDEEQAMISLGRLMEHAPEEALEHLTLMTQTLEYPSEKELFLSVLENLATQYTHDASLWFALARQAQSMSYYQMALTATNQSLALAPSWVSAIALKVQILYQTEQKIAARDYLEEILQKHPEEADLHYIYLQIANELQ
jgi:tetratricopeptide (TPR) repeat protein